jgi:biotin carboxylase
VTTTEPGTGTGEDRPRATARPTAPQVLLLVPARTYRAAGFLTAAARMGLDLVIGSDGALPLGGHPVVRVSPGEPDRSTAQIMADGGHFDAVVAADTPMLVLAATVAARIGLPHNPVDAVIAATDKALQRRRWADAGVAQPKFRIVPVGAAEDALWQAAAETGFACVVKAVSLSASQGVLCANTPAEVLAAARRIRRILAEAGRPADEPLLVEEYVPGPELSIDGLLTNGGLAVTAIFDKPHTPDGPTFEETMLITPSRLPAPLLAAAIATAGHAARALGLTHGPIHAELRIGSRGGDAKPVMLELAARSIGGLCSRALQFPGGKSLEELILANALGEPVPSGGHPSRSSGVFMLPVPRAGVLRSVEGRADAEAVPGITGVTITVPRGRRVRPLPDGDQYLGFVFAEAVTPDEVEKALATASQRLHAVIE